MNSITTVKNNILDSIWRLYKLIRGQKVLNVTPQVEFNYGNGCSRKLECEISFYKIVKNHTRWFSSITYNINPYYTIMKRVS